ncbi:hypothetical protein J6590_103746 [Homalodisca vitripennis]|nr:hypothetical protein J6590_103746 [Homalodisca vitripennis]
MKKSTWFKNVRATPSSHACDKIDISRYQQSRQEAYNSPSHMAVFTTSSVPLGIVYCGGDCWSWWSLLSAGGAVPSLDIQADTVLASPSSKEMPEINAQNPFTWILTEGAPQPNLI